MSAPRRILVRGVNWLGDAVMTTPALQRLREALPDARITLLTHEKLADLWPHHPGLDGVITFASGEGLWSVARRLRVENFDTALVLPNSPRSALEAWLARIPRRLGYARPWRNWLLTQVIPTRPGHVQMHKRSTAEIKRLISLPSDAHNATRNTFSPTAHQTHEYLHLTAGLGANPEPVSPRLVVTQTELEAAAKKFKLPPAAAAGRNIFALNPGAEYGPAKRWPLERFTAAAREIQKQTNCVWLILGGKPDLSTAAEIHSALLAAPEPGGGGRTPHSALNLAGQTSLRELMALLKLCRVLLTNDTGPMHVAAALGTPVVVPFGSTSPELTGPGLDGDRRHWLLKSEAPCSPCFLRACPIDFRCMTSITVERVVEAVISNLKPGT